MKIMIKVCRCNEHNRSFVLLNGYGGCPIPHNRSISATVTRVFLEELTEEILEFSRLEDEKEQTK